MGLAVGTGVGLAAGTGLGLCSVLAIALGEEGVDLIGFCSISLAVSVELSCILSLRLSGLAVVGLVATVALLGRGCGLGCSQPDVVTESSAIAPGRSLGCGFFPWSRPVGLEGFGGGEVGFLFSETLPPLTGAKGAGRFADGLGDNLISSERVAAFNNTGVGLA